MRSALHLRFGFTIARVLVPMHAALADDSLAAPPHSISELNRCVLDQSPLKGDLF